MEIGEVGWDEELELEIVAPKIKSLEIIGKFYNMKKFQIKDVLALVVDLWLSSILKYPTPMKLKLMRTGTIFVRAVKT